MYAVVVTVNITGAAQSDSQRKVLREQIVPQVSKTPGFVKGYWTGRADGMQGLSLVVFDTKEHAEAAANMAPSSPFPPGITLSSVEVREVVAEA